MALRTPNKYLIFNPRAGKRGRHVTSTSRGVVEIEIRLVGCAVFGLWVRNRLVAFACLKDFTSCFRNTMSFSLVDLNVRRMQTEMNAHPASVTPGRLGLVFCLFVYYLLKPSVVNVSQISGLHPPPPPRAPGQSRCRPFVFVLRPSFFCPVGRRGM